MGMFDSKKKTVNQTYVTNTSTVNQQEGLLNLAQGTSLEGNVQISNGVIESNLAMADTAKSAFNFSDSVTDQAFGFGDRAMELGGESVKANGEVSMFSLERGLEFGQTALDKNAELSKNTLGFAESLVNQNTANSGNAMLAIKDLAKSVSTSGASDVAEQSAEIKKIWAGVAVVAIIAVALFLMTKGK